MVFRLSPREKQIVALLCQGYSNVEIAKVLKIKRGTVKTYFTHVFMKTGLSASDSNKRVKLAVMFASEKLD